MRFITKEEIKKAIEEVKGGWQYKADRPFSDHHGDWYLRVVSAERVWDNGMKEYVTWVYNASVGGLGEGRYTFSKEIAEEDYRTK